MRFSVSLTKKGNEKLGFSRKGRRIEKVFAGTLADKSGKIKAGDEIVSVNRISVLNKGDDYISALLRNSGATVVITLKREGRTLF